MIVETDDSKMRSLRCVRAMSWLVCKYPVLGSRARIAAEFVLDAVDERIREDGPACSVSAVEVAERLGLPEESLPVVMLVLAALVATRGIPYTVSVQSPMHANIQASKRDT